MNSDFKSNVNPEHVKKMLDSLSEEQKNKLNTILKDKAATEQILSSPKAKELLKALILGGDNNGRHK